MNLRKMTAPCGLPCFACAVYEGNISQDLAQQIATEVGVKPEEVPCSGCRSENGCCFEMPMTNGEGCKTKKCVAEKGLHNCSECDDFPCENLMPVADMAGKVLHNTKLYNLCRIKLLGLETWSKEAALIQKTYFQGKFRYGQAPKLEK